MTLHILFKSGERWVEGGVVKFQQGQRKKEERFEHLMLTTKATNRRNNNKPFSVNIAVLLFRPSKGLYKVQRPRLRTEEFQFLMAKKAEAARVKWGD